MVESGRAVGTRELVDVRVRDARSAVVGRRSGIASRNRSGDDLCGVEGAVNWL